MSVCAGPMDKTREKRWHGSFCVLFCAEELTEKSKGKNSRLCEIPKNIQRGLCTVYIGFVVVLFFKTPAALRDSHIQTDHFECYYEYQKGLPITFVPTG